MSDWLLTIEKLIKKSMNVEAVEANEEDGDNNQNTTLKMNNTL